jgi:hypothetical protein
MANISQSFYRDLTAARRMRSNERKPVMVVRITRSGQPSKMAEDTHHFHTLAEAEAYIERIQSLNPTRNFQYQVTTR